MKNLKRKLCNQILEPWEPQSEFLGIIGTYGQSDLDDKTNGYMDRELILERYAVASKGPLALEGEYLWKLKDKIDRQWIAGYIDLPDMMSMATDIKIDPVQPVQLPNSLRDSFSGSSGSGSSNSNPSGIVAQYQQKFVNDLLKASMISKENQPRLDRASSFASQQETSLYLDEGLKDLVAKATMRCKYKNHMIENGHVSKLYLEFNIADAVDVDQK